MDKATRFEDLIAWQKARILTKDIYAITNTGKFSQDFGLRDQIRRASVSVMSNIAEGFERNSLAEYGRYLLIAKASCGEVRCQLYIALDVSYLPEPQFTHLSEQATQISRLIFNLRKSLPLQ